MDDLYIKKVLNGDVEAYSYLVKQYQSLAIRTAMAVVKNEKDAQDVVQNSFIQAYTSLSKYRHEAKFSTWLCKIVINKSLTFIKRKRPQFLEPLGIIENSLVAENEAIVKLDNEDLSKNLKKALLMIPAKEALSLQLYYLEEYSIDEIELLTGFTRSNIKVLLHRGRKNLNHILKNINRI